jgi:hypothetical protein
MDGKVREAHLLGKAGEHLVASEMLVRGIVPAWPSLDEGCDLLLSNGCRIQVKTSRTRGRSPRTHENTYTFHFKHRSFIAHSSERIVEKPKRKLSEYCDFVVLVGWDQKRFWIIPSKLLNEVHCVYAGASTERDFEKDIPDMLEMAKLGYSQKEIGKHYGINQSSVYERLSKAGVPKAKKKYVGSYRMCENRWDYILEFGQPAEITNSATESVGVETEGQED